MVLLDVYVHIFMPVLYDALQNHQVIRRVVRQIVKTAIRNDLIVDHIHNVRLQPSDFVCYEPALEMFHEKCFNLNKVWTMNAPLYALFCDCRCMLMYANNNIINNNNTNDNNVAV